MIGRQGNREDARVLLAVGVLLLALTAGSFWIAETGTATAWVVLGIAVLKSHLVAGVFMELRSAPRKWGIALSGFLFAEAAAVVALFS